jgi:hypothetical protein
MVREQERCAFQKEAIKHQDAILAAQDVLKEREREVISLQDVLTEREASFKDVREERERQVIRLQDKLLAEKQAHESACDTVCKLEMQLQEMTGALEAQRRAALESGDLCHQLKQQVAVLEEEARTEHKGIIELHGHLKLSQEEVRNCLREGQHREQVFSESMSEIQEAMKRVRLEAEAAAASAADELTRTRSQMVNGQDSMLVVLETCSATTETLLTHLRCVEAATLANTHARTQDITLLRVQLAARVHELEASVLQKSQADEAVQEIGGLLDKQKQQFEAFLREKEEETRVGLSIRSLTLSTLILPSFFFLCVPTTYTVCNSKRIFAGVGKSFASLQLLLPFLSSQSLYCTGRCFQSSQLCIFCSMYWAHLLHHL